MSRFSLRMETIFGLAMLAASSAHALPIPSPVVIDFETEDDFSTPLVNGQSIYSTPRANNVSPNIPFAGDAVLEFGNLFNVSSTIIGSDGHLGPAIFDSDPADNAGTLDPDLLVGLGNVLILHRDEGPNNHTNATYGLLFNNPNDEATFTDRGSIVFDFLVPLCQPQSIDLVDIDGNVNVTVVLTDNLGRERTYLVPNGWTSDINESPASAGYHTLDLQSLAPQSAAVDATGGTTLVLQDVGFNGNHVVKLEVQFLGSSPSGALDNLVFEVVPEPATMSLALIAVAWVVGGRRRRAPLPRRG